MRYRLKVAIDCGDLGRRVSVRVSLSSGGFGDVVGVLESCDDASFGIRDRSGKLRRIRRSDVAAAKVVPAAPTRR